MYRAWKYREPMASVARGLGFGAPSKVSIEIEIFQWKCPFQNKYCIAFSSKTELQAWNNMQATNGMATVAHCPGPGAPSKVPIRFSN